MGKIVNSVLIAFVTVFVSWPVVAADVAAGKTKAAVCAACHGPDGNSITPAFPNLAGQGAGYLVKQLMEFKSGARENVQMYGFAAALSEQDMQNIAAYYSSQEPKLGIADPEQVELGESIYRGGILASGTPACLACHGPQGTGNEAAKWPRLAGQHAGYTEAQLKAFRAGERNNDLNEMMRNAAKRMTDEEIAAVAQYIQGLR